GDQADQGRLARAVGAEQRRQLALPQLQRDPVQRPDRLPSAVEGLAEAAADQRRPAHRRRPEFTLGPAPGSGSAGPRINSADPGAETGTCTVAGWPSLRSSLGSRTNTRIS